MWPLGYGHRQDELAPFRLAPAVSCERDGPALGALRALNEEAAGISKRQRIKSHLCMRLLVIMQAFASGWRCWSSRAPRVKELINAVKLLAVSTGKLRVLPHFHIRPIDPVVFREPMYRSTGNVILRRVSRLYAFSVYPGRT